MIQDFGEGIGFGNSIPVAGTYATVGGGEVNTASGDRAFVGGGDHNQATDHDSTVSGGGTNQATNGYSTVSGGVFNTASGNSATVGGGEYNIASGKYAAVPGGLSNSATMSYTLAAGRRAKANHDGAFVWADSTNADFASTANNQFLVRASGGITMYTNSGATTGVQVAPGGGSWASVSDRNLKANFQNVNSQDVLARVSAMPIQTWNYTSQDPSIHHIGPMAQDFYAAFNVGEDDKHITSIDSEGVALAAIQGLDQIAQAQAKEIAVLKSENAAQQKQIDNLDARLTALEQSTVAAKSPPNDFASNGWVLGALLGAVVLVGTRRWGGTR